MRLETVLVLTPAACVLRREVLRLSSTLDGLGPISWKLALCLAAVWLICYFCVWKGVKSTGKVRSRHISFIKFPLCLSYMSKLPP